MRARSDGGWSAPGRTFPGPRAHATGPRRGRWRWPAGTGGAPAAPVALRNVTVGWGTWFGNRRVGLRDRWFRLRTSSSYRGAPQP